MTKVEYCLYPCCKSKLNEITFSVPTPAQMTKSLHESVLPKCSWSKSGEEVLACTEGQPQVLKNRIPRSLSPEEI